MFERERRGDIGIEPDLESVAAEFAQRVDLALGLAIDQEVGIGQLVQRREGLGVDGADDFRPFGIGAKTGIDDADDQRRSVGGMVAEHPARHAEDRRVAHGVEDEEAVVAGNLPVELRFEIAVDVKVPLQVVEGDLAGIHPGRDRRTEIEAERFGRLPGIEGAIEDGRHAERREEVQVEDIVVEVVTLAGIGGEAGVDDHRPGLAGVGRSGCDRRRGIHVSERGVDLAEPDQGVPDRHPRLLRPLLVRIGQQRREPLGEHRQRVPVAEFDRMVKAAPDRPGADGAGLQRFEQKAITALDLAGVAQRVDQLQAVPLAGRDPIGLLTFGDSARPVAGLLAGRRGRPVLLKLTPSVR